MKKTLIHTCRTLASISLCRFAGLGILAALTITAEAGQTLNLSLQFNQSSIPAGGTGSGTFLLNGNFTCNGKGDSPTPWFLSSYQNLVTTLLPLDCSFAFDLLLESGTVTYDGVPYTPTSADFEMILDGSMSMYYAAVIVRGDTPVVIEKYGSFSNLAGTFTMTYYGADELTPSQLTSEFTNDYGAGLEIGSSGVSAVPEPGSLVSVAALLSSAALIRTRRKATAA
jgi:hypothetical protein